MVDRPCTMGVLNSLFQVVLNLPSESQVEGLSIRTRMESIHGLMGVCPQHNLLWDTLTVFDPNSAQNPKPRTLNPKPYALFFKLSTLNLNS